jgi:flagellar M-ring protein FliF
MRPSAIMGKKQINGIVHLVASSVEGLDPSNVTIVSSSGEVLFVGGDSNSPGMLSSSQFEMTQNVEKYFEGKIQGMMDGVLGPGKAIVRVSLDLNFDQINTEKETFDPETVLRSEQTTKVEGGEGGSNREETVSNYEVSKTVSKIISEVGDIKRMTVALVVDGSYKASEEEEGAKTYTPRSEEELQKIEDLVKDCVNYNEERGDEVKIQNIPFDTSYKDDLKKELAESDKQMAAKERKQLAFAVGDKALKVIVVVLVIFFAFRTLKDMRPKGAAQQGSTINMVSGGDAGMPGGMGGAPGGMSAGGGQEQAFNPDSIVGPPPSFEPPPPVIQPPAAAPENDQKAKEIADAIKKKWLSS